MSTTSRRIGKYEMHKLLGSGSAGEVWKSYDLQYRREVAIKIFHTDLQSDPNFINRLLQEGKAIASLHHPNIVRILDANIARPKEANGTIAYMVMDYIEGPTLAYSIRNTSRRGAFPPVSDIVYLFTHLAAAIDYTHEQGIIHGNIKPASILLKGHPSSISKIGEPLQPMLSDFGIARSTNSSRDSSGGSSRWNSVLYISPEQARGVPPTRSSDIYSLGVILYEICTGVPPFRSESPVVLMMQHINMLPTSPMLINTNIPSELSAVILRALAKDPAVRFTTASQMAAALADACSVHTELNRATVAAEQPIYKMISSAPNHTAFSYPSRQRHYESVLARPTHTFLQTASIAAASSLQGTSATLLSQLDFVSADVQGVRFAQARRQATVGQSSRTESNDAGQLRERLLIGSQAMYKEREPGRSTGPISTILGDSILPTQLQSSRATRPLPAIPYGPVAPRGPARAATRAHTSLSPAPTLTGRASFTDERVKELETPPAMAAIPSSRISSFPGTSSVPLSTLSPLPPSPAKKVSRSLPIYAWLASTLLLVIIGSALGTLSWLHSESPQVTSSSTVVGYVFFQDDTFGHNDVLRIEMQNIPDPAPGKSYYAWLFNGSQNNQATPTLLGKLAVNSGQVHFVYPDMAPIHRSNDASASTPSQSGAMQGQAQHSDLLANVNGLLITEEDAIGTPSFPSSKQVYAVKFAQATHPANYLSVLDNVRNLLSGEQQLNNLGVSGGLALWLLKDTSKAWLWASNARDYWEGTSTDSQARSFIRGQIVHILDVFEGKQLDTRDAPIARVALLEQNAVAPDYLDASLNNLNAIAQAANATADQKASAHMIQGELQQVKNWLQKVHQDAIQLLNMTDQQFIQPQTQSILDDMATQANYAYNGQNDLSPTPAHHAGMAQIYIAIQRLATFAITLSPQ